MGLVTNPPFGKLACALGIMAALVPAVSAAPPDSEPVASKVEMWHGMRRVNQPKDQSVDADIPQAAAGSAKEWIRKSPGHVDPVNLPGAIPQTPAILQQAPGLEELPVPVLIPTNLPDKALAIINPKGQAKPGVAEPKGAANKQTPAQRSSDLSETQEAAAGHGASGSNTFPHTSEPPAQDHSTILIQVAFILAAAIVAPLVSILCFFWLLQRHSRRFGPLFRVDYVGNSPVVTGPFSASTLGLAGQEALASPVDRADRLEDLQPGPSMPAEILSRQESPEPFELGPTFEEERLQQEMQANQQEEAILQHLFEENLRLHEQIQQEMRPEDETAGDGGD